LPDHIGKVGKGIHAQYVKTEKTLEMEKLAR